MSNGTTRDAWGSRLGLILAAAGNAIGIGNLLRFPGQAAQNGGGAFMIPYVACLLIFGLPMMWVAWAIGRHGGRYGHGSLPGMFSRIWPSPIAKYVGVLGLSLPMVFVLYYTYIEAWCLGYAVFSFQGDYFNTPERFVSTAAYFNQFLGDSATETYFTGGVRTALGFMGVTLLLNLFVLSRGVAKGIEVLAKVAIPLLFLFCALLAVRVFTFEGGRGSAVAGLDFLWTPNWDKVWQSDVWLAAAGQIFFTLSIGFGALECYASYVREEDDIALTGLTTASTNEFVEVIFGSLIAIPAIAVFYGAAALTPDKMGEMGTFGLGMISIPEILRTFPSPHLFSGIWFLLLFFAAFTSSVAVAQPVMAFFQDELRRTRAQSALLLSIFWIVGTLPVALFYRYGFLEELDLWSGNLGLVFVAFLQAILFGWIWGVHKGYTELARGSLIRVPPLFKVVVKYVTPLALFVILVSWTRDELLGGKLAPVPKFDIVLAHPEVGDVLLRETADLGQKPAKGQADQRTPQQLALTEAIEGFDEEVKSLAESEGGDGQVWLEVDFGADGRSRVVDTRGTGVLAGFADAERWTQYLNAKRLTYNLKPSLEADPAPADERAIVVARVLHTKPYIWLARSIIIVFTLVFLVLIAIAFKGRDLRTEAHA